MPVFSKLHHRKLKHTITRVTMWAASLFISVWFICAVMTGFGYVFI